MAQLTQGDLVRIRGCEQIGEVLHAGDWGRCLVHLPQLDAVVVLSREAVTPLSDGERSNADLDLRNLQFDAASYLQTLQHAASPA